MSTINDPAPRRRRWRRQTLLAGAGLLTALGAPAVAAQPASAAGYCTTWGGKGTPAYAYCSPSVKARYQVGASCASGGRYYGRIVSSGSTSRTKISCKGGWYWIDIIYV